VVARLCTIKPKAVVTWGVPLCPPSWTWQGENDAGTQTNMARQNASSRKNDRRADRKLTSTALVSILRQARLLDLATAFPILRLWCATLAPRSHCAYLHVREGMPFYFESQAYSKRKCFSSPENSKGVERTLNLRNKTIGLLLSSSTPPRLVREQR
jgi:hypothetical protein